MREVFHQELGQVGRELSTMTDLAAAALRGASVALLDADMRRAHEVIRGDDAMRLLQEDFEGRVLELLARQSPVAGDLRLLVCALRAGADLERMSGLAVHLARTAERCHPACAVPEELAALITRMAASAAELADGASLLIAGQDASDLASLEVGDETVDRLHRELLRELLDPAAGYETQTAVDLTLVGRYYERFADHALAIARRLEFAATGEAAAGLS